MKGAGIGIFIILAVIGAAISGCVSSGDNAAKEKTTETPPDSSLSAHEKILIESKKQDPNVTEVSSYGYVPQPVDANPDLSDPYKLVEEAVDAIAVNDYKAFEKLITPYFRQKIGDDDELRGFVWRLHDDMFLGKAGKEKMVDINVFEDKSKAFISYQTGTEGIRLENAGGTWRIEEW